MKGHVGSFLFGLGLAAAGAFLYDKYQRGDINVDEIGERIQDASRDVVRHAGEVRDRVVELSSVVTAGMVDINQASPEDLERIGLHDRDMADRLIEGRPYRNKMDLLTRMIVPQDVYDVIKNYIDIARPDEAVKVA
jgi:DNA uptake protein ComE-like DNA-binding protein